jgi:hypothetical protein
MMPRQDPKVQSDTCPGAEREANCGGVAGCAVCGVYVTTAGAGGARRYASSISAAVRPFFTKNVVLASVDADDTCSPDVAITVIAFLKQLVYHDNSSFLPHILWPLLRGGRAHWGIDEVYRGTGRTL